MRKIEEQAEIITFNKSLAVFHFQKVLKFLKSVLWLKRNIYFNKEPFQKSQKHQMGTQNEQ